MLHAPSTNTYMSLWFYIEWNTYLRVTFIEADESLVAMATQINDISLLHVTKVAEDRVMKRELQVGHRRLGGRHS